MDDGTKLSKKIDKSIQVLFTNLLYLLQPVNPTKFKHVYKMCKKAVAEIKAKKQMIVTFNDLTSLSNEEKVELLNKE